MTDFSGLAPGITRPQILQEAFNLANDIFPDLGRVHAVVMPPLLPVSLSRRLSHGLPLARKLITASLNACGFSRAEPCPACGMVARSAFGRRRASSSLTNL